MSLSVPARPLDAPDVRPSALPLPPLPPGWEAWASGDGPPLPLPCYLSVVPAGFPSSADDYIEQTLDLNERLVDHPAATFFIRVAGESMRDAGVNSGDILVVDRAVEPGNGKIVVAAVNGELTLKRLRVRDGRLFLCPENPTFPALEITQDTDFQIWGVATYAIHKL